jgi:hypothetical protein
MTTEEWMIKGFYDDVFRFQRLKKAPAEVPLVDDQMKQSQLKTSEMKGMLIGGGHQSSFA